MRTQAAADGASTSLRWPSAYFLITALIPGHLVNWAVEWGFAAVTTIVGAILYPRFHRRYRTVSSFGLVVVACITFISVCSYVLTVASGRFATGPRDWIDLLRPFMVYFSCTLAFCSGVLSLIRLRRLACYVLLVTLIATVALLLDLPVLGPVALALYGSTKTAISATLLRVSIPFENPNFLGLFSVVALSGALLFGARPHLPLAGLALFAIAMTGSRTAWLTSALILPAFLADAGWSALTGRGRGTWRSRTVLVAAAVGSVGLAARYYSVIVEANQRFFGFVEGLATLQLLSDPSYVERQQMRVLAVGLIEERFTFGWGALKQSDVDIVDNQYVSLLLRAGAVGVLILGMGAAGLLVRHLSKAVRDRTRLRVGLLWLLTLAWLWNGSFAENIRLSVLVTMMFASTVTHDVDALG